MRNDKMMREFEEMKQKSAAIEIPDLPGQKDICKSGC
jgi:hypothetical protein